MRHLIGSGTPRGLQDRLVTIIAPLLLLLGATRRWLAGFPHGTHSRRMCAGFRHQSPPAPGRIRDEDG
jgi:hypothetical protein